VTTPFVSVDSRQPALEVVPLGGLGEFGMNMTAICWGETLVLVDAGVMFPDPELLGVDLVIPDLTYLERPGVRVAALVLTHGHEDHIGGVPHVLPRVSGPVYGTPFTLALVEPKLEEHGIDARDRLVPVRPGDVIRVGELTIEFVRVTHSIPDSVALVVGTPVGTIVHTGDYKIDQTPIDGERFDLQRFAKLGDSGVLALFADSTNVERPGVTGSEIDVVGAFEEIFAGARGRLIVTAFATSIYRVQILADLAAEFGRKIVFAGRGMVENSQIAQRLGHLKIPPGLAARESDVRALPPGEVLCVATGARASRSRRYPGSPSTIIGTSQPRRAIWCVLGSGDSRARAGDRAGRQSSGAARRRRHRRVHQARARVRHGSEEELKLMLSLVRPRHFVPIHGSTASAPATVGLPSA